MLHPQLLYSQKKFFQFFPPPQFLLMPSVGIDISDHFVRFMELIPKHGTFIVGRFGEQILPSGTIVDGEIKDPNTLKTVLIGLRRDHDLSFVRGSMPEEKAYLFRTEVPELSPEETRENIAFQLEEYVPINPADAVFDYAITNPLFGKTTSGLREAVVSVFPRLSVEAYIDVYKGAGLTPLSLEMEGSALARGLIKNGDQGTYLIVDLGAERTSLAIFSRGAVRFTTTIDIGGEQLTSAIERQLNVSHEEADKLKKSGAFSRNGQYRELFPILLDTIVALKEQVSKHYVYWHNHPDKKDTTPPSPIEKIILSGGDANLEGLTEHFSLAMQTTVQVGNVWTNAFSTESYIPPVSFASSLSYGTAIGLALREE
ncbi:MAG: pilus assembly protein PilM [bacterium]|nr:pilus assembly protein PilM [bacterium]